MLADVSLSYLFVSDSIISKMMYLVLLVLLSNSYLFGICLVNKPIRGVWGIRFKY